jgi:outer membrane protein OmpA-like peptidoglycan-associated protein
MGQSNLLPAATANLDQLVNLTKGHDNVVVVKGHTALDDLPLAASATDRMDLSLRRAQAVADYLVAHGVSPEVVRVEGCSTFEPIVEHIYTADERDQNRRVEVEALDAYAEDFRAKPKIVPLSSEPAPAAPAATQPAAPPSL